MTKRIAARSLFLAVAGSTCICSCTGILGPSTNPGFAAGRAAAGKAPRPVATAESHGLLYWMLGGYGIEKIKLSNGKQFRNREYGSSGGLGLATDRHHNVYQSYDSGADFRGYVVLDKHLTPSRTVDIRSELPYALTVDAHDEVYVACLYIGGPGPSVEVFSSSASGDATPIRTITGSETGIVGPSAIAVDGAGYVYLTNEASVVAGGQGPNNIEVFAPRTKGNRAPVRVIAGDLTGITDPANMTLGADGNIYVANQLSKSAGGTYEILVFPTTANGNVAPVRLLQSGSYGSTVALGSNGLMYLGKGPLDTALQSSGGFAVYAPGASGNDQPLGYIGKNATSTFRAVLEYPWYQP